MIFLFIGTHTKESVFKEIYGESFSLFIVGVSWCPKLDEVPYMYVCMTQSSIQKKMLINSNSECWREVSSQFMCSKI